MQVLWQKRAVQGAFPVVYSSWALFSLSFTAYVFLTTQQTQLSQGWVFFPSPSPCTPALCPFERRTWLGLVSGLISQKSLTPLTSAFMLLSLEEDEFDAGRLAPACRI